MTQTGKSGVKGRPMEIATTKKGLLDRLEWLALVVAGCALVGVVAVQAWQVFARYVLNNSPSWTEPLAILFIGLTAMLGAAVGVRRETHFGFPLLADAAPRPIRIACRTVSRLAMIALGAGLAFYGAILVKDGWEVAMAGAGLPVGLRFAPVSLGGALIVVFALERLIKGLSEPAPAHPAASAAMAEAA
jgi:TRAP-type C4-dicarboxylate transport system permease small subunit